MEINSIFGGGIVGYNEGGIITHCEISLSNVGCYKEFENDTEDGYTTGHYAAIGGIVGYTKGGTISYCSVGSNVRVRYDGYSSQSRTLAPEMGIIAGRSSDSASYYSNEAGGETSTGELDIMTWTTGALWWKKTHTWDQAQYVGGSVGRYV